jgi:phosphatidylglycerophosphate synthase
MAIVTRRTRTQAASPPALGSLGLDLTAGLAPLVALAVTTRTLLGLPTSYLAHTVVLYLGLVALLVWVNPVTPSARGLGAANRVTLLRATLLLPVATLALRPASLGDTGYWWIIAVSTVAMLMDGVDGWVARRAGATEFGARFDMELDALLLLALAVLVWLGGKVGPWVVLIGALRYLFVAAGWIWPALDAALPPSTRRKTVCVLQGAALLVCLGPIIPGIAAKAVAAVALALLVYSFGVDVRWLIRRSAV